MVEYIILVAIIAVASLGIIKVLGSTVSSKLSQITLALQGKNQEANQVTVPKVEKKHYQERSLEDFYESTE